MSCCNDKINLGCFGSCKESIVLSGATILPDDIDDYKVYAVFNGVKLCATIEAVVVDGDNYISMTSKGFLNEDYSYTIEVYNNSVLETCYEVKIEPEICVECEG